MWWYDAMLLSMYLSTHSSSLSVLAVPRCWRWRDFSLSLTYLCKETSVSSIRASLSLHWPRLLLFSLSLCPRTKVHPSVLNFLPLFLPFVRCTLHYYSNRMDAAREGPRKDGERKRNAKQRERKRMNERESVLRTAARSTIDVCVLLREKEKGWRKKKRKIASNIVQMDTVTLPFSPMHFALKDTEKFFLSSSSLFVIRVTLLTLVDEVVSRLHFTVSSWSPFHKSEW